MKLATSLKELYRNLTPSYVLRPGEDDAQYVHLYDDLIKGIRFDLINNELSHHTVYVTGQSGTGKTCAMYFLPDQEINDNFEIVHIEGNELFDLNDVDIVDVLFRVAFELIEKRKELEKTYKSHLAIIEKKIKGRLSEEVEKTNSRTTGISGELGIQPPDESSIFSWNAISNIFKLIGLRAEFAAQLKNDREVRKKTREVFDVNKEDLKELVNEIIRKYEEAIAPRQLLVIIHDLERLLEPSLTENLFIKNRHYLEAINCKKIISAPVALRSEKLFTAETTFFGIKLKPYPFGQDARGKEIEENVARFRKIVQKRMVQDANLIDEDALDLAIRLSGGIVRQYLYIVQNAAKRAAIAGVTRISRNDIDEGALAFRRDILVRHSITSKEDIQILDQIRLEHKPAFEHQNRSIFMLLLQANQILACQNGEAWYDLNPLIEETIKLYAQK